MALRLAPASTCWAPAAMVPEAESLEAPLEALELEAPVESPEAPLEAPLEALELEAPRSSQLLRLRLLLALAL